MRARFVLVAVSALVVATPPALSAQRSGGTIEQRATPVRAGEPCPPGTTEVRPRLCQAPELPAPSILDYRPRSTLVVPAHPVPRAKYPAIDFHGHPRDRLDSGAVLERLGVALDSLNVRLMLVANNMSGPELRRTVAAVRASPRMRDRVRVLAGVDFRNVGPGWAEKAVAQLEADVAAGAVGVGEVSKSLGLSLRKADGSRLRVDDRALDPVWEACARLRIPVFIHTADPQEFWQPIDERNERWLELTQFPNRRRPADRYPSFDALMAEQHALFRRHPNTTFINAHLGWYGQDLAKPGALLDSLPNMYTELGAVVYELGRQPRMAREFLTKYQDSVLMVKDTYGQSEYHTYFRIFETADEYFPYYRKRHAHWNMYGLDLPDPVLRKLYYGNAIRIIPGIDRSLFPSE